MSTSWRANPAYFIPESRTTWSAERGSTGRSSCAAFTARYNVHKLVYFELFGEVRVAIAREKQLKGWLRKRKIALIESMNPSWKDLADQLAKARAACRQSLKEGDCTNCHSERSEESLRRS